MERLKRNPKQDGTILLDAVPQKGMCELGCPDCYFNRAMAEGDYHNMPPFVPTAEEAEGMLVRVCSGNDANVQRGLVIESTKDLRDKWYCTRIPQFDFPGPVVYTCNGNEFDPPHLAVATGNIMAVRFRYNPWNKDYCDAAIDWYCVESGRPLLITPMRYYHEEKIPEEHKDKFVFRKATVHSYWVQKAEKDGTLRRTNWGSPLVWVCAGLCKDCQLCVHLYHQAMSRRAS